MNASSFERALRGSGAPVPDPQARLNAKHAALDEFARTRSLEPAEVERELERAESERRALRRHRRPAFFLERSTSVNCFAGAASACITGLGVIMLWTLGVRYYAGMPQPIIVHLISGTQAQQQAPERVAAQDRSTEKVSAPARGERFASFASNPVKGVVEEPVSTFPLGVDTDSYTYVRRQLDAGLLPREDAVRAEEMINYFDYSWPAPASPAQPFTATVAVSDSPWGERNKLVHIGIKGYEIPDEGSATQRPTIAKDVRIQVEFNPFTVSQYRLVGYEARALVREDFDGEAVQADGIGSGQAVTAIYEITPTEPAGRPSDADTETYGDLSIRYTHPDGRRASVIEQPILVDTPPLPPSLRRDVEFATSVAGFAQLLRGGAYTGALTFEDVIRKAESARGDDPEGQRAEFVELVREAQSAKGM